MELKDRIAAVRRAAGLTQEQLGELVGVTRQAVSKWEAGQTVPDALTVAKLCEALHVSADYVLLGKEPEEQAIPEPEEPYVLPDACPCCGWTVEGTICPNCGYPLPDTPPRGRRYAVLATSQYYANEYAMDHLIRFCGMGQAQAQRTLQLGTLSEVVLRRGLTDDAAQYLASHLNRHLFPDVRVVVDEGEPEDTLRTRPDSMHLPERTQVNGVGFWGVVAAVALVMLAMLVLSLF